MKNFTVCLTALVISLLPAQHALSQSSEEQPILIAEDHGKKPWTTDIEDITLANTDFRRVKWTGSNLQMTLMSIPKGGQIGGEIHSGTDQFLRIEKGTARVIMGDSENNITFDSEVSDDWAVLIPAGSWHNLINTGDADLKLYSIYSPPEHLSGTVHPTFEASEAAHAAEKQPNTAPLSS